MDFIIRKAEEADALDIVNARSRSFYDDYVKFGECPGYQIPVEEMKLSIHKSDIYVIEADGKIIGDISVHQPSPEGCYWIGCVEILPEYQNYGIGSKALQEIFHKYPDAKKWQLDTPVQRERNCHFYEKLGFYGIEDKVHSDLLTLRVYEKTTEQNAIG